MEPLKKKVLLKKRVNMIVLTGTTVLTPKPEHHLEH